MAINKNHEFEELDGVKCGIVEKNVQEERASFLKNLLEYNGYSVKVVEAVQKKVAPPPAANEGSDTKQPDVQVQETPVLYTVGVTDYTFNPVNAIFGRLLKTKDGRVVTLAYWQQQEPVSRDDVPYFDASQH